MSGLTESEERTVNMTGECLVGRGVSLLEIDINWVKFPEHCPSILRSPTEKLKTVRP